MLIDSAANKNMLFNYTASNAMVNEPVANNELVQTVVTDGLNTASLKSTQSLKSKKNTGY